LRRKLIGKGYDPAVVDQQIERLCTEKLIDDGRYLENFVASRAARGRGPNRVRADLRHLGLPSAQVESSLQAYADWISHLRQARQKKFGSSPANNYADRQRQARFLAYRGYTGAQIRSALGFDIDLDADTKDEI
jgi:regulatory protein